MLSCAGTASKGADPAETAKRVASKRRGEDHLRSSGLGYTIIRPGEGAGCRRRCWAGQGWAGQGRGGQGRAGQGIVCVLVS
jgi:hypothetical protein